MSSGQGFDFFGFDWWYSFNKKTFRSFRFLERKKESDFLIFQEKKEKKREVEGSLFFCFSSHTDERILSVEKTKVTHHLKRVFSQPVEIFFRGL